MIMYKGNNEPSFEDFFKNNKNNDDKNNYCKGDCNKCDYPEKIINELFGFANVQKINHYIADEVLDVKKLENIVKKHPTKVKKVINLNNVLVYEVEEVKKLADIYLSVNEKESCMFICSMEKLKKRLIEYGVFKTDIVNSIEEYEKLQIEK